MKPQRNDPCPCGSGKKYKRCCLGREPEHLEVPREILETIRSENQQENLRRQRFGQVRPILHADFQDHKFVAVGNQLLYAKEGQWQTFPDFLSSYIKSILGNDWGNAEIEKPLTERHQIMKWYDETCRFQKLLKKGDNGLYAMTPNGSMAAYLYLAYDLYILRHHSSLQNEIIGRLKNKDQFQGARYELYVAATCIRADFEIQYEDETDRSTTHPEFIAVHQKTGQQLAVEAKSRHRQGVLDFPGDPKSLEDTKADIGRLLNQALKKATDLPYVIFVDVNLPLNEQSQFELRWLQEILRAVGRNLSGQTESKYNLLLFTNHPHHYGRPEESDPQRHLLFLESKRPKCPAQNPEVLKEIGEAAQKCGNIPNEFPPDFRGV